MHPLLYNRPVWDDGLLVTFHTTGGHPIAVAARNRLPSLGSRDILFTWRKLWTGEQRFYVKPHELQPGRWLLGIFDMDYYERTSFDYYLSVDTANITGRVLSPFASVGFGVTASLFLFAMFSVFRRILWERHVARCVFCIRCFCRCVYAPLPNTSSTQHGHGKRRRAASRLFARRPTATGGCTSAHHQRLPLAPLQGRGRAGKPDKPRG